MAIVTAAAAHAAILGVLTEPLQVRMKVVFRSECKEIGEALSSASAIRRAIAVRHVLREGACGQLSNEAWRHQRRVVARPCTDPGPMVWWRWELSARQGRELRQVVRTDPSQHRRFAAAVALVRGGLAIPTRGRMARDLVARYELANWLRERGQLEVLPPLWRNHVSLARGHVGVSARERAHRVTIDGQGYYAFCVGDAARCWASGPWDPLGSMNTAALELLPVSRERLAAR